jgi:hypothetical protein
MILRYSDDKMNTKTYVFTQCDKCSKEQRRKNKKYEDLKKNPAWIMDYCEPCWASIRQKTPQAKETMSKSITSMIKNNPEWILRNSESKKGKINLGENNGMKSIEARKKVSSTRKEMMKNGLSEQISKQMKSAWENGKFDGVKVGRSKWYHYKHTNGNVYKVQGRYEYHFIEWLDKNSMQFKCHPGRIKYVDSNGDFHSYFPDFFIYNWNCYVEIKNKFLMSMQEEKFNMIRQSNPDIEIKILLEEDLNLLGINCHRKIESQIIDE